MKQIQKTKPGPGEQQREIRVGALIANILLFWPGSIGSWWNWRTRIRSQFHNANEGEPLDYLFRQYRAQ